MELDHRGMRLIGDAKAGLQAVHDESRLGIRYIRQLTLIRSVVYLVLVEGAWHYI
jgi:hypothetical protein